jgi:hypothetical protein
MEIIRNCSHNSSIQVALELDQNSRPVRVIKTSFNQAGALAIRNEHEGISWYEKKRGEVSTTIVSLDNYRAAYSRLELLYHNGRLGDPTLSLARNYNKMRSALDHYMAIFAAGDRQYSHGDYSLDNIVFNNDTVAWILDWESFTDKLPKEFDIIYCVVEASFFCYMNYGMLSARDVRAAIDLLSYGLGKLAVPHRDIVKAPGRFMRKLFRDNEPVFGEQFMKYPLVNSSEQDIKTHDGFYARAVAE